MELIEGSLRIDDLDAFLGRLDAIGSDHGVAVQAFDARYIAGRDHLQRACELADRARDRGEAIARDPAVEILLYAAGRRQIERAFEMGVSPGHQPAIVVCHAVGDGEDDTERERAACELVEAMECLEPAETVGESDPDRVAAFFDISNAERAATDATLSDLVLERVAMLVVEK